MDDSNSILKNSNYITNFLDIISSYEKVSGSKVNVHKTVGLVIQQQMQCVYNNIRLTMGPERVLGANWQR